jgi:hypothetical protein
MGNDELISSSLNLIAGCCQHLGGNPAVRYT